MDTPDRLASAETNCGSSQALTAGQSTTSTAWARSLSSRPLPFGPPPCTTTMARSGWADAGQADQTRVQLGRQLGEVGDHGRSLGGEQRRAGDLGELRPVQPHRFDLVELGGRRLGRESGRRMRAHRPIGQQRLRAADQRHPAERRFLRSHACQACQPAPTWVDIHERSPRARVGRGMGGRHTTGPRGPPDPHRRVPVAHGRHRRPTRADRADRRVQQPPARCRSRARTQAGQQAAGAGPMVAVRPDSIAIVFEPEQPPRSGFPGEMLKPGLFPALRPLQVVAVTTGAGQPGRHRRAADHRGRTGPGAAPRSAWWCS